MKHLKIATLTVAVAGISLFLPPLAGKAQVPMISIESDSGGQQWAFMSSPIDISAIDLGDKEDSLRKLDQLQLEIEENFAELERITTELEKGVF